MKKLIVLLIVLLIVNITAPPPCQAARNLEWKEEKRPKMGWEFIGNVENDFWKSKIINEENDIKEKNKEDYLLKNKKYFKRNINSENYSPYELDKIVQQEILDKYEKAKINLLKSNINKNINNNTKRLRKKKIISNEISDNSITNTETNTNSESGSFKLDKLIQRDILNKYKMVKNNHLKNKNNNQIKKKLNSKKYQRPNRTFKLLHIFTKKLTTVTYTIEKYTRRYRRTINILSRNRTFKRKRSPRKGFTKKVRTIKITHKHHFYPKGVTKFRRTGYTVKHYKKINKQFKWKKKP